MLKALAIKELRESLGIVALAVLALGYVILGLIGVTMLPWQSAGQPYFPFSADAHSFSQAVVLGAFILLLGLRQTAWELHNGTFYYLLHRPLPRWVVFAVKLVVGTALVLLVNALFVGIYGWWAATPGTHPTPFFWSMTLPLLTCPVGKYRFKSVSLIPTAVGVKMTTLREYSSSGRGRTVRLA